MVTRYLPVKEAMKYLIERLAGFNVHSVSGNDRCYDYFLPILNWVLGPQTSEERGSSTFSWVNFAF